MSYTSNKYKPYKKIPKPSKAVIYFLKNKGSGHIKIGYTFRLQQRILTLQSANSDKLFTWGLLYVDHDRAKFWEHAIHDALKEYNIRGEWFNVPEDTLKHVYSVYKGLIGRYI